MEILCGLDYTLLHLQIEDRFRALTLCSVCQGAKGTPLWCRTPCKKGILKGEQRSVPS